MTRFIQQTMQAEDGVAGFVTDIFNVTTIVLVGVLGLLTVAATI